MLRILSTLLFVPHCPACDSRVPEEGLCAACAESLYELGSACPRCAEPLAGPVSLECRRCRRRRPPFCATHAPYRYGGELAVALRRLKYERRPDIARSLAPLLAPAVLRAARDVDVAIPIPLHWRRLSARGFNQAVRLLAFAGAELPVPIDTLSLRRVRVTASQSGLSARERERNVQSAFAVTARRRPRVAGKRVLLFDDVMTTGATMASAARAVLAAGARQVVACCAARAES